MTLTESLTLENLTAPTASPSQTDRPQVSPTTTTMSPRRLRRTETLRRMVREHRLHVENLASCDRFHRRCITKHNTDNTL